MRALLLAALLVAAALAGCAGDAGTLAVGEPTFSDADVPLGRTLAPLEWRVLHEAPLALTPATPLRGDVQIPNGTVQVLVNLTLDGGAAYGIAVSLGECTWRRALVIVGDGNTIGADCGGVSDGAATLGVGIDAGALAGTARVVGIVCMPTPEASLCPNRLPATSDV